jgi:dihydropyrimidinase
MVSKGRMSINDFVDLTSTQPAKIYGLYPRKGTIAVGADADIVIWDPARSHTIRAETQHDRTGYTPFEGRVVTGYPETVLRRGEVIVENNALLAKPGSGRFLGRDAGPAAEPSGVLAPEFEQARNFGADLSLAGVTASHLP